MVKSEDETKMLNICLENNFVVVGYIDMDAFEVQIYLKKNYGIKIGRELYLTKPCILADSTTDRIISVNYLAKDKAISREDRVGSALQKCPNVIIIRKYIRFNKPENINLRHSSWEVLDAILKYNNQNHMKMVIEFASNDEYYLDLTEEVNCRMNDIKSYPITEENLGPNTYLEGCVTKFKAQSISFRYNKIYRKDPPKYWQESRLIVGAVIIEEIRNFIFSETNFESSGSVACNKLLAKIACPLNKPAGLTILPQVGLKRISSRIPIEKLPSLGGDRGILIKNKCNEGQPMSMKDLAEIPSWTLSKLTGFGIATTMIVRKLSHGIYKDPVTEKLMKGTVSVGKANFRGLNFFKTDRVRYVLLNLFSELMERLKEEKLRHHRIAENICVEFDYILFPRDPNNKGKPLPVKHFTLEFKEDPSAANLKDIVTQVLSEFLEMFKDQSGVIAKVKLSIMSFVSLLEERNTII